MCRSMMKRPSIHCLFYLVVLVDKPAYTLSSASSNSAVDFQWWENLLAAYTLSPALYTSAADFQRRGDLQTRNC